MVKWRDIGLGLGLENCELNGIEKTKCHDPQACMMEVFSQWYSAAKGEEYSWKKLAEVLVLPAVKEKNILGHMYQELNKK